MGLSSDVTGAPGWYRAVVAAESWQCEGLLPREATGAFHWPLLVHVEPVLLNTPRLSFAESLPADVTALLTLLTGLRHLE